MAKRSALSQGINTVGHFTRNNLERMGSFIDSLNAKTGKPHQYKAVNLDDDNSKEDLFREQTLKTTQQLIGTRFATYGKYAKKVVPNSLFQSTIDSAFSQVAKLASSWSQMDLPSEHRFADLSTLDDSQRYALATDIANQNRALATLGGLTGLAGLPGLLADTLWLLLVSLRTVYQLAAVYDKPLTGKQGVKMAYELLANADLSKMQEKQALLAGIGMGKGLLDNAQSRGLHSELQNLGFKNKNVNFYAEQVDSIASQVGLDLDQINLTWLRRFLPLTAVAVGMSYNSRLIDEVIGVAKATFAPQPKLAKQNTINDDSSSEKDSSKKEMSKGKEQDKSDSTGNKSTDTGTSNDTQNTTKSDSTNKKAEVTDKASKDGEQEMAETDKSSTQKSTPIEEESVDATYEQAQASKNKN